jgi:hypothetical protein
MIRVGGVEVAALHWALLCLFGSKRVGTGSYSRPSAAGNIGEIEV